MVLPTIKWFHVVTGHPGTKRLRLTLQAKYYHPDLRRQVDTYLRPDCQRYKLDVKGTVFYLKKKFDQSHSKNAQ